MINGINKIYLGDSSISKAYLGTDIVFTKEAEKLLNWEYVTSNVYTNLCYGTGRLVYKNGGYMYYSDNYGVTGTKTSSAISSSSSINDSKYFNTHFIQCRKNGIVVSIDGASWSTKAGSSVEWVKLAASNNTIIAIPKYVTNKALYSNDGDTWTSFRYNISAVSNLHDPVTTYGYVKNIGNRFVVINDTNGSLYPTINICSESNIGSGNEWSYVSTTLTLNDEYPVRLEYFNNYFILGTSKRNIYISEDLNNWIKVVTGSDYIGTGSASYFYIVPGNNCCTAIVSASNILTTRDGVHWNIDNTLWSSNTLSVNDLIYAYDRLLYVPAASPYGIYQAIC